MSQAKVTICLDEPIARIAPEIYGHFAEHLGGCVAEGLWVGEDSTIPNTDGIRADVLQALRRLRIPVLRWPGGCYADDYHWEDGVGPRKDRPRRVNIHWGQNIEENGFGTHEFMQLCRLLGAQPYLAGNVGSGSVRELREWVEYCNFAGDSTLALRRAQNGSATPFGVRYWGVGNENWGCGGNFCPEDYAAEYKRYATYMRDFSGTPLYLIACGPNQNDLQWTQRFLRKLGNFRQIHGLSAHFYTWNNHAAFGTATAFSTEQAYGLLSESVRIEEMILQQRAMLDCFEHQRHAGLIIDEWGAWHPAEPNLPHAPLFQQNTMRDALLAAVSLNIFHRHADKIAMANIAQVANVLQAMVLTDGPRMTLTPTFFVFEMYQPHQAAQSVRADVESGAIRFAHGEARRELPRISASASILDQALTLSLVNVDAMLPVEVILDLRGGSCRSGRVTTLAEELQAHNTFDDPQRVQPSWEDFERHGQEWRISLPPGSVSVVRARLQ